METGRPQKLHVAEESWCAAGPRVAGSHWCAFAVVLGNQQTSPCRCLQMYRWPERGAEVGHSEPQLQPCCVQGGLTHERETMPCFLLDPSPAWSPYSTAACGTVPCCQGSCAALLMSPVSPWRDVCPRSTVMGRKPVLCVWLRPWLNREGVLMWGSPLHAGTRRALGGEVSVADKSHFPAVCSEQLLLVLKIEPGAAGSREALAAAAW